MTKVEREVVFNSENGQKEMTGVRHSDDDVKKKVIDCVFKLGQLNNIPEKYVEKNSDCSRSSVGRVYRCNFDGRSPIPNWTTIFNFFSCVIGKATIIVNIPEVQQAVERVCHTFRQVNALFALSSIFTNHYIYTLRFYLRCCH